MLQLHGFSFVGEGDNFALFQDRLTMNNGNLVFDDQGVSITIQGINDIGSDQVLFF